MSWAWGRRSIGKVRANRSGSSSQPPAICGVSDEVAQVSMMSGSPMKPPGWPRWLGVSPAGTSEDGSIGQRPLVGHDRVVVVDVPVGADGVPDREGHAEEALAGDQPVAVEAVDPVLVAVAHVGRVPVELLAPRPGALAQVVVAARRCGCTTGGW